MSNMATALPNTIIPMGPDTTVPASNLHSGKGISNHGDMRNLTAEQTKGYRSEGQLTVENQPNNDADIGSQINEGKRENFQEVLQRQLSEESDQKEGPSDDEKSESHKTEKTSDDKSSEQTEVILPSLLEALNQVLNTALTGKGKSKTGSTAANNEKTTSTNNSGKETMPQQKIVPVSSQQTGESKPMSKQTSEQISNIVNEQIKNTEEVKTKDGKPLTLTVQEGKAAVVNPNLGSGKPIVSNENQAAVVNPNPGSGKSIVSNENQAAVINPNPGSGKLIVANENSAIINNNQSLTLPKPPENVPNNVPKPTAPQMIETPKAVVINEKINLENIEPSTEQKSLPAEDIKALQITEKLNNIQTDSAGKKQNTAAGNDKQAVLNNNKTTSQQIDADDIDISYARAQNDSIAVNGAIKTMAESVNGSQNISSVANVSNTTASNPTGLAGNISASTPGEQIIQNLKSNPVVPDRQINISLNPPELGRIRITFQQTDGEITGLLEVEKAQARYDVEKSLPQIIASLQENGVQVQRINVVLDEQSQSNQPKNSFAGDFEGTEKQEFSGETRDNKSDGSKPGSSGSTLDSDFQQARQKVVNEISDDAISAYA